MIIKLVLCERDQATPLEVSWPALPRPGDHLQVKPKTALKRYVVTGITHKFDAQEIEVRAERVKA